MYILVVSCTLDHTLRNNKNVCYTPPTNIKNIISAVNYSTYENIDCKTFLNSFTNLKYCLSIVPSFSFQLLAMYVQQLIALKFLYVLLKYKTKKNYGKVYEVILTQPRADICSSLDETLTKVTVSPLHQVLKIASGPLHI